MKITFHGAAHTVTGSQHLIEVNGKRVLLDCGLYQGRRAESYERNRSLPFDPASLDAVILSHAHIDHSGNLPNLVKSGFSGPIHATSATSHLSNIMLIDSGHIQEMDAQYINKQNSKHGLPLVEPLYTLNDAAQVAQHFRPVEYDQPVEVVPGVTATLVDAGHILGSAAVALDIEERGRSSATPRRTRRLWFSGDIGRRELPLLRDPILPSRADFMIMECTYGDKPHEHPLQAYDELRAVINRTAQRHGKVIIPSFAVGRTQDLVYNLNIMMDGGEIPPIPVVVDSPLAVNASDIYKSHPECFDEETRQFIAQGRHRAALTFKNLTYTRSVEESKALNDRTDPMVIISASGMAENGRIRHHLKNNIEDRRNTILIVSWQAPHTLGRRIADRFKQVNIFGETYEVRAEVVTIGGFSAHGGQTFLLEYAAATRESVKGIYLVHGEPKSAQTLREKLAAQGQPAVSYPELHESVEL
jgi:metallo-beta-lactamase family protein